MLWRRTEPDEQKRVSAPIRVFHIEDDPLAVDTVCRLMRKWPEYAYLGAAATGAAGIRDCEQLSPDIVLLDLGLPDIDGLQVLDVLRNPLRRTTVVLLTMRSDEAFLYRVMLHHAFGVLWKSPQLHQQLRQALAACTAGFPFLPGEISARIERFRRDPRAFFKLLSDREISLLPHLGRGDSDERIAASVGLSPATIHSHRQNIARKLDLHTSAELMRWCAERGFSHFPHPALQMT